MARIRLWMADDTNPVSLPFLFPDGTNSEVANHRLYCRVFATGDAKGHEAVVDTGAPCTLFPLKVWKRFQPRIEWLKFAGSGTFRRGTMAGKSYHFRFGRITVQLAGRSKEARLPPVEIVAQFEQFDPAKADDERLTHTVVGLQFGPLEGRYLVVGPRRDLAERCEAWVTDERPVDPLVLTSATL